MVCVLCTREKKVCSDNNWIVSCECQVSLVDMSHNFGVLADFLATCFISY